MAIGTSGRNGIEMEEIDPPLPTEFSQMNFYRDLSSNIELPHEFEIRTIPQISGPLVRAFGRRIVLHDGNKPLAEFYTLTYTESAREEISWELVPREKIVLYKFEELGGLNRLNLPFPKPYVTLEYPWRHNGKTEKLEVMLVEALPEGPTRDRELMATNQAIIRLILERKKYETTDENVKDERIAKLKEAEDNIFLSILDTMGIVTSTVNTEIINGTENGRAIVNIPTVSWRNPIDYIMGKTRHHITHALYFSKKMSEELSIEDIRSGNVPNLIASEVNEHANEIVNLLSPLAEIVAQQERYIFHIGDGHPHNFLGVKEGKGDISHGFDLGHTSFGLPEFDFARLLTTPVTEVERDREIKLLESVLKDYPVFQMAPIGNLQTYDIAALFEQLWMLGRKATDGIYRRDRFKSAFDSEKRNGVSPVRLTETVDEEQYFTVQDPMRVTTNTKVDIYRRLKYMLENGNYNTKIKENINLIKSKLEEYGLILNPKSVNRSSY